MSIHLQPYYCSVFCFLFEFYHSRSQDYSTGLDIITLVLNKLIVLYKKKHFSKVISFWKIQQIEDSESDKLKVFKVLTLLLTGLLFPVCQGGG